MEVNHNLKFKHFDHLDSDGPIAGKKYLVRRNQKYSSIEVATFMHCTFENSGTEFKGFAQYTGSESERDQMERWGLNDMYFRLIEDVDLYAAIPLCIDNYLDYDLIIDREGKLQEDETRVARELMSCFLQGYKLHASKCAEEEYKRDLGEKYNSQIVERWERICGIVLPDSEGFSMSLPEQQFRREENHGDTICSIGRQTR